MPQWVAKVCKTSFILSALADKLHIVGDDFAAQLVHDVKTGDNSYCP